ncbi:MAG: multiheme c-type cytochrome [Terriglobales bacterium]
MRIPNLLTFLLLCICGAAFGQINSGAAACAGCHRAQSASQPQTPMGRALTFPESNAMLKTHPKLTFRRGAYSYAVETRNGRSTYSVTDGKNTISLPVNWSFGAGVQAWILNRDGKFFESLVSYYPASDSLDVTIGDESLTPHTVAEAVGRPLVSADLKDCLGCHATNSLLNGRLNLDSFQPGVTCEHCHQGAGNHVFDAIRGDFDSAPPNLSKLSTEDASNFCGQCHRSWETVVRNHWRGPINVRFQPYRLANSKCYDGADPRISCLACHDPHQDVVRQASSYDSKCLACHTPLTQPVATPVAAKSCPVSKSDCATCHMPKVKLPDENVTFTDHQIRIVKAGDPYPN